MDESQIAAYIRRKFGDCVVGVELTIDQIDDAIQDAKWWFASYIGQWDMTTFVTVGTQTEYDVVSEAESVVEVIFPVQGDSLYQIWAWAGVPYNLADHFYHLGEYLLYSDLVSRIQYLELSKKVASADRDWEWDRARRKLIISPNPGSGYTVAYVYMVEVDVTKLDQKESKLVRDYAYACAMETLGNIRTKFSDWPSAQGTFTMNGDTLLSNSETLKMNLDEKILTLREPIGVIVG